jgi:hypothetical protein
LRIDLLAASERRFVGVHTAQDRGRHLNVSFGPRATFVPGKIVVAWDDMMAEGDMKRMPVLLCCACFFSTNVFAANLKATPIKRARSPLTSGGAAN